MLLSRVADVELTHRFLWLEQGEAESETNVRTRKFIPKLRQSRAPARPSPPSPMEIGLTASSEGLHPSCSWECRPGQGPGSVARACGCEPSPATTAPADWSSHLAVAVRVRRCRTALDTCEWHSMAHCGAYPRCVLAGIALTSLPWVLNTVLWISSYCALIHWGFPQCRGLLAFLKWTLCFIKHRKAKVGYSARIPETFLLIPWKFHKSISFGGGVFISISILFEDISYFCFYLFRNFYSLSLSLEVCIVVFNEGICSFLEIIILIPKCLWCHLLSLMPGTRGFSSQWSPCNYVPVLTSNSQSVFSCPCFLVCCPLTFLV